MRTNHYVFALTAISLVASGCTCAAVNTTPDATQDSSEFTVVIPDVVRDIIHSDSIDVVEVDTRDASGDDVPGPDMLEEVCGSLTTGTGRSEGQPCEMEGESYCTNDGAYPRLLAVIGWQCIKPGVVTCVKNKDDKLTWETSNCEETLSPIAASCGLIKDPVPCLQYDKHAVCCPYVAYSPLAGYGPKCELSDLGNTTCSPSGQKPISSVVYKCGYQTEIAAEQDQFFSGQEYSNINCESIYAECPYWYRMDYCGRDIEDCRADEGCTLVEPPDSYPYYSCPGVCFFDGDQDVNRCTTTCDELDDFYKNN